MLVKLKYLLYRIYRILPIHKNRILLFSYYGSIYGGSPKYLSEYFVKNDKCLEVVWAFNQIDNYKNIKGVKLVKYYSIKYFYYLATSHFIITNYRMTLEFYKRLNQKYIQTWHSSLRLKMIEKDAQDTLSKSYIEMARRDSKQIDLLLVGSEKSKEIYDNSFWYKGKYLKCGTPQCDLFFSNDNLRSKVLKFFKIDNNKKILLYAPTFRRNHSLKYYDIDYDRLLKTLNYKTNNEWVILLRLHPHLLNKIHNINFNNQVKNATKYDDIQELLSVADMVVTDYSALMFDYMLTKKPCFLYINDYEEYVSNDRKLYFDVKELPFPISYTNDELNEKVSQFIFKDYEVRCEEFLKNNIYSYDDGQACKKVYEYIKGEMK
ncbi:CDP-glycerol glycerophosphotransferase family protein [Thomasclavelia sp.]